MSQLLHLDFYLKDQASVATFTEFMTSSRKDMAAEGYKEVERYVNQEDPLHLIFLVRWTSREHFDAAMAKMFAQADIAKMLEDVFTQPAKETWIRKID